MVEGLSPLRPSTSLAANSRTSLSASHSATTFTRPPAMASRRMFLPHQPEPMSAVRNFRAGSAARMNGAAVKAAPATVAVRMNWRRSSVDAEVMVGGGFGRYGERR